MLFRNRGSLIVSDDETLLSIKKDEFGVLSLSGKFFDMKGTLYLEIVNNEIKTKVDAFDIKNEQKLFTIWDNSGRIVFRLIIKSPSLIVIDKFQINHHSNRIFTDKYGNTVFENSGNVSIGKGGLLDWEGPIVMGKGIGFLQGGKMINDPSCASKGIDIEEYLSSGKIVPNKHQV